jgi:hypothetical protein
MLLTEFDTELTAFPIVFETEPVVLLFEIYAFVFARFVFAVTFTFVFDPQATANAVTVAMHPA